jgi:hypothetical protein
MNAALRIFFIKEWKILGFILYCSNNSDLTGFKVLVWFAVTLQGGAEKVVTQGL